MFTFIFRIKLRLLNMVQMVHIIWLPPISITSSPTFYQACQTLISLLSCCFRNMPNLCFLYLVPGIQSRISKAPPCHFKQLFPQILNVFSLEKPQHIAHPALGTYQSLKMHYTLIILWLDGLFFYFPYYQAKTSSYSLLQNPSAQISDMQTVVYK